jgi:hypothetical protein
MPLKRAGGAATANLNRVEFSMQDVVTGASVSCKVSEDALRKLSGGASSITSLMAMFKEHRAEVERLASDKYDRRHASPHVQETDF